MNILPDWSSWGCSCSSVFLSTVARLPLLEPYLSITSPVIPRRADSPCIVWTSIACVTHCLSFPSLSCVGVFDVRWAHVPGLASLPRLHGKLSHLISKCWFFFSSGSFSQMVSWWVLTSPSHLKSQHMSLVMCHLVFCSVIFLLSTYYLMYCRQ